MVGARRFGRPRTEAERRARHKRLYGSSKLPPRGTGLKMVNPRTLIGKERSIENLILALRKKEKSLERKISKKTGKKYVGRF